MVKLRYKRANLTERTLLSASAQPSAPPPPSALRSGRRRFPPEPGPVCHSGMRAGVNSPGWASRAPSSRQRCSRALQTAGAAMPLQLENVLAGVGMGGGEVEGKPGIDGIAVRSRKSPACGPPRLRVRPEERLQDAMQSGPESRTTPMAPGRARSLPPR